MSLCSKDLDPAFLGAGTKAGLEIWCIENLRLVPVPKSSYGKFYNGNAYVILNSVFPKEGPPQYDVHYWLGINTTKAISELASDKALELDATLGSCSVQYREVQGQESYRFLSYFRPCIIPIEGVYSSECGSLDAEYRIRLFSCKGDHVVHVKEVAFSRSSLNHRDVFILDTASKIFLFSGCNSSIQERAKALEVVEYIKESNHNGNSELTTIEDGKFVGDPDVGEFWSFFGGYAPIPRDLPSVQNVYEDTHVKLFWINTQGKLCPAGSGALSKAMLEANKCYMLDCDAEIFVWFGKQSLLEERKISISAVEDYLRHEGRSNKTHSSFLCEGLESTKFKSYFCDWPKTMDVKLYQEGREKVAAMFKQHGYTVKELPDYDDNFLLGYSGKLNVWQINGDQLTLLTATEQRKLFSGDCYIVQYSFSENGRDGNLFFAWFGCNSVMEDRSDAISHMITLVDSSRGSSTMAQVVQGREPVHFFSIFQQIIIFKGGLGARYKKLVAQQHILDETYEESKVALFRVQGNSPKYMQVIQVEQVSTSLNSSYCYILQNGTSVFMWIGSLSSSSDLSLLDRTLDLLNPTWQPTSVREGNEPNTFWDALGGKAEYPRAKELPSYIEDPHLFAVYTIEGHIKVKEIYNFTQDDLATEDVFVLDCKREIYVWVGSHSRVRSKQEVLALGLKILEMDVLVEGLSLETPIYVVTEGQEPPIFTRFFTWDPSKPNMHGNSFERKLAIMRGKTRILETPNRNQWKADTRESTPTNRRSRSVTSDGRGSSSKQFSSPTPVTRKLFSGSNTDNEESLVHPATSTASEESIQELEYSGNGKDEDGQNNLIYPFERLKVVSSDPITGIDVTKREAYLSNEEFNEKFGMTKKDFYKLPKWKQNKLKMSVGLF